MTRKLSLLLGLALTSTPAFAGGFEAKTMRDTLAAREVERGLVIGKGWLEFGLGADVKIARGEWSPDGEPVDWASTEFLYTTERLDLRYGVSRRGELYWSLIGHYIRLTDDDLGTDISQVGLGDPHFGYKFEAFRSMAPMTSLIVYGDYKAPAANESPGSYVGGPTTFRSFIMTTGTPDITVGARGKRQVGPVAVTLGAAYVRRLSALTQYIIETDYNQFSGRIKPGDITQFDGELLIQLGPVALQGGAIMQMRQDTRMGNTVDGWFPARDLKVVADSGGASVDGLGGLTLNLTRGVDLVAMARVPLQGEDLQFFPIEDIQPTRGNTYSGTLEFRY